MKMIVLSKSAQKYYDSTDLKTKKKFQKAFDKIEKGYGEKVKDISSNIDLKNVKRIKIEHYRIIFKKQGDDYCIHEMGTKNDMKFRKTGYK